MKSNRWQSNNDPKIWFRKLRRWVEAQWRYQMDPTVKPRRFTVWLKPIGAFLFCIALIFWEKLQIFLLLLGVVALLIIVIARWFNNEKNTRKVARFREHPRL